MVTVQQNITIMYKFPFAATLVLLSLGTLVHPQNRIFGSEVIRGMLNNNCACSLAFNSRTIMHSHMVI